MKKYHWHFTDRNHKVDSRMMKFNLHSDVLKHVVISSQILTCEIDTNPNICVGLNKNVYSSICVKINHHTEII